MATDSRIDTWTETVLPVGDEIIPAQNAAGAERVITPAGIAYHSSQNPRFYGFAVSGNASQGNTAGTGVYPLAFPNTLVNTVGGAWNGTANEFTVPAEKDGVWMVNFFIMLENMSGSGGSKSNFSIALQAVVNAVVGGGDQMVMTVNDLTQTASMTLNGCFIAPVIATDTISVQTETNFDGTFTYDAVTSGFRAHYLGAA